VKTAVNTLCLALAEQQLRDSMALDIEK